LETKIEALHKVVNVSKVVKWCI